MSDNPIIQKLALLPEGLIEKNIESWKVVLNRYQGFAEKQYQEWILPVFYIVQKLAVSEYAKLYRAGTSLYSLMISTVEKHGLKEEDPFICVHIERNIKPRVYYRRGPSVIDGPECNSVDEFVDALLPLLDRLWDETRGQKKHG